MVLNRRIFFSLILKKTFHFIGIFLFLLLLLSCCFKNPTVVKSELSTGEIEASAFCSIDENYIFSTLALIDIKTSEGFYPVKAALMIKRPSYLRMELLPVIGVPDFFLTISPEKMKILIPSKGEFYSGSPNVSNMKKFLPWPIEIEDMIMILTGMYPSFKENNVSYQVRREDNVLRMEMKAPAGHSQIIWLGENNKLLKIIRKDETGEELYNVKYTYNNDDSECPEKITINMADETTSLSVKYSDVNIEKQKDLSVFDLAIPDNVKEFILE